MPSWIGPWELLIVLAVVILIFGPKRVPQAGRSLSRGFREFKDGISGKSKDEKPEIQPATLAVSDPPARKRFRSKK